MVPIVGFAIGEKLTTAIVVKLVIVAAVFTYAFKKSREIPLNDIDLLKKIERDAGRGDDGGGGRGDKDPKEPWDKRKWIERAADLLSFSRTKEKNHGEAVYQDGLNKISFDRDGHCGGFWKLFRKDKRVGTFDITLTKKIGD